MASEKQPPLSRADKPTLDAIVRATEQLIGEGGYWQTSLGDIQSAAGIARSTFYSYFPSKLAAFLHVCGRVGDALYEVAGRHYPDRTEYERIVLANHAYLMLWRTERKIMRELFALSLAEPQAADFYRRTRARFEERIAARVRLLLEQERIPPTDPVRIATLLTGMVETFAQRMNAPGAEATIEHADAVQTLSEAWWRVVYVRPVPDFDFATLDQLTVELDPATPGE